MPPKRRRRFQGLYYHSSPPKVLPMNGQTATSQGRKRRDADDFAIKLSTIRIWMHEKDIGKLTRTLWAGQGSRLCQQASTNTRVKRFLTAVPYVMNSIKDVHQAVIDNNLETLQSKLEPPVPPALITSRDANGLNLIHKAAGLGHTKILEYLIGVWPDGINDTDITGKTPLHWAASAKNNMRCYTLLTQAGCDEEAMDYKMKTASYYRHKPHEIERAFLLYVPEAPRVSPDVATDWEALCEDSSDGKKLDIKIPEANGLNGRATDDSIENTSEVDLNDGVSTAEEEHPPAENGSDSTPTTPAKDEGDEAPNGTADEMNGHAEAEAETEAEAEPETATEPEPETEAEEPETAAADAEAAAEADDEETNTKALNETTMTTNDAEADAEAEENGQKETTINGHSEVEENEDNEKNAEEQADGSEEQQKLTNGEAADEQEETAEVEIGKDDDEGNEKEEDHAKAAREPEKDDEKAALAPEPEQETDDANENETRTKRDVAGTQETDPEENREEKGPADEQETEKTEDTAVHKTEGTDAENTKPDTAHEKENTDNTTNGNEEETHVENDESAKEHVAATAEDAEKQEDAEKTKVDKEHGEDEEKQNEKDEHDEEKREVDESGNTKQDDADEETADDKENDAPADKEETGNSEVVGKGDGNDNGNEIEHEIDKTANGHEEEDTDEHDGIKGVKDDENQKTNDKTDADVSNDKDNVNDNGNDNEKDNEIVDDNHNDNDNIQDNDNIVNTLSENHAMDANSRYEIRIVDGKIQKFLKQDQETGEQTCVKKVELDENANGSASQAEGTTERNGQSAGRRSAKAKSATSTKSNNGAEEEGADNAKANANGKGANGNAVDNADDDDDESHGSGDDDDNDVDIGTVPATEAATEDEQEEAAAVAAVAQAVAGADKLDENHNEEKYAGRDGSGAGAGGGADADGDGAGSSPTSSLAIEGFVVGSSDDNRVQSQSAAYVDEANVEEVISKGDMEQLAQIVLNGDGGKLVNMQSSEPEIQAFLNNVPSYMSKIRRVHEAAREGSLLSLQQALDRRKFAIAKDEISPNGATPLHVAVLFGNSDIVRYLAARFPETTTITDNDGRTALHYAATIKDNGHFYNVLTQLGANTKSLDKLGHTPEFYLHNEEGAKDILNYRQLLSAYGAEELEDELLSDQGQTENHSYESNPIFRTEQGKYLATNLAEPLIKALTEIANKRPEDPIVFLTSYLQNYLQQRNPFMTVSSLETDSTAPMYSNKSKRSNNNAGGGDNNFDLIEEDNATNADAMEESILAHLDDRDEHGQSMLHFACARSHRRGALMHLIEESHINIAYRDELYRTARDVSLQANQPANAKDIDRYVLSLAVVGDTKPLEQLVLDGYDHIIDVIDDNGANVIQISTERGHEAMVEYLRNLRSLEELREELHQMIRDGNMGRVKEIADGPNGKLLLNAKNYYGRNAMHIAVLKENVELVEYFVALDSELLKIGDNLERTALHFAMGANSIESLSRILIQNGAKRTSKDLKGRQPSYYFMNKADILRLQEEEEENR